MKIDVPRRLGGHARVSRLAIKLLGGATTTSLTASHCLRIGFEDLVHSRTVASVYKVSRTTVRRCRALVAQAIWLLQVSIMKALVAAVAMLGQQYPLRALFKGPMSPILSHFDTG